MVAERAVVASEVKVALLELSIAILHAKYPRTGTGEVTATRIPCAGAAPIASDAWAVRPAAVMVIVVEPLPTAVTMPVESTVALEGSLELQLCRTHPASGAPRLSRTEGARASTCPTESDCDAGVTATDEMAGMIPAGVPVRVVVGRPIDARAICCASMMFTAPSAFTSPALFMKSELTIGRATANRDTCCASRMFTTVSPFTSPHLLIGTTQTSSPRDCSAVPSATPASVPPETPFKATRVPPIVGCAVK